MQAGGLGVGGTSVALGVGWTAEARGAGGTRVVSWEGWVALVPRRVGVVVGVRRVGLRGRTGVSVTPVCRSVSKVVPWCCVCFSTSRFPVNDNIFDIIHKLASSSWAKVDGISRILGLGFPSVVAAE